MKDKVYIGAKKRYGHVNVNVQDRIDYELGLLLKKVLHLIFLLFRILLQKLNLLSDEDRSQHQS